MLDAEERMEIQFYRDMGGAFGALPGRQAGRGTRFGAICAAVAISRLGASQPPKGSQSSIRSRIISWNVFGQQRRIRSRVLFREIRQRGYRGGETRAKDFVRSLRPLSQPDPVVRFETGPGQQMQADWASIRGGKNRLSVFVATSDQPSFNRLRLHEVKLICS
jgi:hypothetical protein